MLVQQKIKNNNYRDPLFDRKVDLVTAGLQARYARILKNELSYDNALIICNYITSMKTEVNLSDNDRRMNIDILGQLSKFYDNQKPFNQITREDILSYLDSLRKPETLDPLHKWVGTYNLYGTQLKRFFKWLYYPDIEPSKRPKPNIMENIPTLRRKEKSIYKPSDLWTPEEDLIFLRYCPSIRSSVLYEECNRGLIEAEIRAKPGPQCIIWELLLITAAGVTPIIAKRLDNILERKVSEYFSKKAQKRRNTRMNGVY
jgi:hypothetical protein